MRYAGGDDVIRAYVKNSNWFTLFCTNENLKQMSNVDLII